MLSSSAQEAPPHALKAEPLVGQSSLSATRLTVAQPMSSLSFAGAAEGLGH